jgi:hypothetical protein
VPRPLAALVPLTSDAAEISGLDYDDELGLLILPQYPARFDDAIYRMAPENIERWVSSNEPLPLLPMPIAGLAALQGLEGYEGFEAIQVLPENRIAALIEQRTSAGMSATLVVGRYDRSGIDFTAAAGCRTSLRPPSQNANQSLEALTYDAQGGGLLALAEINGPPMIDGNSVGYWVDQHDCSTSELWIRPLPYRTTDAAPAALAASYPGGDTGSSFVSINYQWDGDTDLSTADTLTFSCSPGARGNGGVEERLVRWRVTGGQVVFEEALLLQLDSRARNWEGLARIPQGFVLATDKHPDTRFAFVPDDGAHWLDVHGATY